MSDSISDDVRAFLSANGKKGGEINKKKGSAYFKWVVSHRINNNSSKGPRAPKISEKVKIMLHEDDRPLNTFLEKEKSVLRKRYGLNEQKPMTLAEIGNELGLTRERVRQIEQKALSKLNIDVLDNDER